MNGGGLGWLMQRAASTGPMRLSEMNQVGRGEDGSLSHGEEVNGRKAGPCRVLSTLQRTWSVRPILFVEGKNRRK